MSENVAGISQWCPHSHQNVRFVQLISMKYSERKSETPTLKEIVHHDFTTFTVIIRRSEIAVVTRPTLIGNRPQIKGATLQKERSERQNKSVSCIKYKTIF